MKTYYSISSDIIDKDNNKKITLRKDGVNLYELEWRKPTEYDIGKMCWLKDDELGCIALTMFSNCDFEFMKIEPYNSKYLLADHGQIAPTEQDFIKVYGDGKRNNR